MNDAAIDVERIWKKFHRGEMHDSLRDVVPAVVRRMVGRGPTRDKLGAGDFWALKDVSLHVRRGEALGIIGPNGAGKSTLLKILSKILKPNRGRIRVRGRLSALIEVSAGFHPDLTGRENIYLNGAILGMRTREINSKLDKIIDFSGIEAFIDTPVKRFSSGMQARLGFSVAAHMEPEVLLVDEVLSVGDVAFRAKCVERMKAIVRDSQAAVLFVSHHMEQIRQLCDKCCVLGMGEVAFLGDAQQAVRVYFEQLQRQTSAGGRDNYRRDLAQVKSVRVTTPDGRLLERIERDEPFTIEIGYEVYQPQRDLSFIISLDRGLEVPITQWNSEDSGLRADGSAGQHKVRLAIERIPLTAGDHMVNVAMLSSSSNPPLLDRRLNAYPLIVSGALEERCLVHVDGKWSAPG